MLNALIWTGWSQEGLHLENVLRGLCACFRRTAQSAQRKLVGTGCTAQSKAECDPETVVPASRTAR